MSLFNRRRETELENQVAELQRQLQAKQTQIDYLIRTIRNMDDIIFAMSQCDNWPSMREKFIQLAEGMTARKVIESERIGTLVEGELRKTYDPTGEHTKQLENMRGK